MTVLAPTTGETKYGTWLEVSTQNEVGAQQLQTPYCASNGRGQYSECSYVGGPGRLYNPSAQDVSWRPVDVWTAANDATSIDGIATFQITSCYHGTASCPSSEWGYSGPLCVLAVRKCDDAVGRSYLDIDQLYPGGSVCQVNRLLGEEHRRPSFPERGLRHLKQSAPPAPLLPHIRARVPDLPWVTPVHGRSVYPVDERQCCQDRRRQRQLAQHVSSAPRSAPPST